MLAMLPHRQQHVVMEGKFSQWAWLHNVIYWQWPLADHMDIV